MSSTEIKDIIASKLSKRYQENITQAKNNCIEAKKLLKKYNSGETDKQLIYQALELYQEAIELNSKLTDPYIGVAYISYSVGKLNEAIGYLNTALEIEPSNHEAQLMRDELLNEWEKEKISRIISKESGKSLASSISDRKESIGSVREKFSAMVFSGMLKKKTTGTEINTAKGNIVNQAGLSNKDKVLSARSNFFYLLNNAKTELNNK